MTAHEEHPISVTGDKNNSLFVSIPGLDFSLFKTPNFSNKHNHNNAVQIKSNIEFSVDTINENIIHVIFQALAKSSKWEKFST